MGNSLESFVKVNALFINIIVGGSVKLPNCPLCCYKGPLHAALLQNKHNGYKHNNFSLKHHLFFLSIPLFFLFLSQRNLLNVLESSFKKKEKRESWRKKERMKALGIFLNEGEKENKRMGGQRQWTRVWRRKTR